MARAEDFCSGRKYKTGYGEINGLYTYDREICKVNKEELREVVNQIQKKND